MIVEYNSDLVDSEKEEIKVRMNIMMASALLENLYKNNMLEPSIYMRAKDMADKMLEKSKEK